MDTYFFLANENVTYVTRCNIIYILWFYFILNQILKKKLNQIIITN